MAGLPRSGSTVLAALLNQHPDIYASPQSDLLAMIYELDSKIPSYESYKAGLFHDGYKNLMGSMTDNFYSNIDKSVVIDKNRGWGTPYNFDRLSPYVNVNGKIILTLRPILEVLASFVRVMNKTEKTLGYAPYFDEDLWATSYRTKADAQVEWLMQTNGEIERAIFSVSNLLKNHGDRVFVVWFDNLTESPQETMNGIYDFLGVDRFTNNFKSISEADTHDDISGYGIVGLHDIGKKLVKPNTKPENYLSDYIMNKYENTLDFLWSETNTN
jgi:sulfotransferase